MSNLVYTHTTFPDGIIADGDAVIQNFNDAAAVINGQLDDTNLANNGITANTKIKDGTIDSNCMGVQAIRDANVAYPSAAAGVKVWQLGPNYPGAGGGQVLRIEKSITIAAVTTEQSFAVSWAGSDAADGAFVFSAAPTITGVNFLDAGTAIDNTLQYVKLSARSTTGCTIKLKFGTAPTGGVVTLMFIASGGKP